MRILAFYLLVGLSIASCVPAKKYNELLEQEKLCSEELAKYKAEAISFGGKAKITFKQRFLDNTYSKRGQLIDLFCSDLHVVKRREISCVFFAPN